MKIDTNNHKGLWVALLSASLWLATGEASAALIDRGNGMIYDTDLDITWLQNANMGAGSSYDDGFSTTDGLMIWQNAVAWAANLVYGGYDDWRLPTALNQDNSGPCSGYNCTGSEMGHLFYSELGVTAGSSILDGTASELAKFSDIQSYYWSGTEGPSHSHSAWYFSYYTGFQDTACMDCTGGYAWAVRDGDVAAAVPEPGSLSLLGAGSLLGWLGGFKRRSV